MYKRQDLCGTLPVDFENDVVARLHLGFNPFSRSAVQIAVHNRPLEELPSLAELFEARVVNEKVIDAVAFAWAWWACREGHR